MFTTKRPSHLEDLQGQVDEVMDVMRHATEAVLYRGARLNELSARAEALEHQANAFLKRTTNIRKKTYLADTLRHTQLIFYASVMSSRSNRNKHENSG
ncbi:hypothetical protein OUZ56_023068 [Daphnia magna]|uniref:V-SNARE coiled-coil homology domain-containing protein n=1 Tax=Daphnia magna TaxID=35525 RepID=A0ABR0AY91_9CRUS|nr:hypothetical protein OUZ56_023068 [Daphnia magna]